MRLFGKFKSAKKFNYKIFFVRSSIWVLNFNNVDNRVAIELDTAVLDIELVVFELSWTFTWKVWLSFEVIFFSIRIGTGTKFSTNVSLLSDMYFRLTQICSLNTWLRLEVQKHWRGLVQLLMFICFQIQFLGSPELSQQIISRIQQCEATFPM